ncbi:hypothetical protein [Shinella kummerowiae]|uniref:hypothetical protein n=1 Tax=Shinella kummerowiae TaxID=417745 RepID=UPI0021B67068|nr:hypothetical protein [Shinella kummerowiae]MCT7665670.1 hypothetical protein [Shinella kummerowiae]
MAKIEEFGRELRFATAGLSHDAISKALAKFAREELAKVIKSGEGSPIYDLYVNGRPAATEDIVDAPGPIVYEFSWWRVIVRFALDWLAKNSPRRSGKFSASFIVLVDGKAVSNFDNIPPTAEVMITNAQPYVRKVQVGAMKMSVPPRIFDRARGAVSRKFGSQTFRYEVRFLSLGGGVHPLIPYVLKHSQGRRKDRQAGMPITYPALVMSMVQ